jgi:beta-glucanase (GH16 family)
LVVGLLVWGVLPGGLAAGNGWRLAFNAQFRGSRLDTSVWSTCYPWAASTAPGCNISGNHEYEWDLPSQAQVSGGVLHLVSQPVPTRGKTAGGAPKEYACRSGVVTSYPGFRFTYGYVQVVARIPSSYGLWPALWLAAANLNWPPEIDMIENYGPPQASTDVAFHPVGAPPVDVGPQPGTANLAAGWHTISVDWTPTAVTWFIDGHKQLSVHQHIPHQPMYFIADLADYRPPQAGRGCAGSLLIRSVKVWQRRTRTKPVRALLARPGPGRPMATRCC